MSFYTIFANYDAPLAAAKAHIHVTTHIEIVKDGDSYALNWPSSGRIQDCSIAAL